MTDTPELKPCPFCAEKPHMTEVHHAGGEGHIETNIVCSNCGIVMTDEYTDDVAKDWNSRPSPEPAKDVEGLIERLEAKAQELLEHRHATAGWLMQEAITALQSQASADQIIAELESVLTKQLEIDKKRYDRTPAAIAFFESNNAETIAALARAKAWREAG